mmetsp:Transcript_61710/g.194574  ORF Transcript_61710/g.194574 Transcript_61710/m.194574 type:complete len:218 (-) Transcript_61710:341-994(-)
MGQKCGARFPRRTRCKGLLHAHQEPSRLRPALQAGEQCARSLSAVRLRQQVLQRLVRHRVQQRSQRGRIATSCSAMQDRAPLGRPPHQRVDDSAPRLLELRPRPASLLSGAAGASNGSGSCRTEGPAHCRLAGRGRRVERSDALVVGEQEHFGDAAEVCGQDLQQKLHEPPLRRQCCHRSKLCMASARPCTPERQRRQGRPDARQGGCAEAPCQEQK